MNTYKDYRILGGWIKLLYRLNGLAFYALVFVLAGLFVLAQKASQWALPASTVNVLLALTILCIATCGIFVIAVSSRSRLCIYLMYVNAVVGIFLLAAASNLWLVPSALAVGYILFTMVWLGAWQVYFVKSKRVAIYLMPQCQYDENTNNENAVLDCYVA